MHIVGTHSAAFSWKESSYSHVKAGIEKLSLPEAAAVSSAGQGTERVTVEVGSRQV